MIRFRSIGSGSSGNATLVEASSGLNKDENAKACNDRVLIVSR